MLKSYQLMSTTLRFGVLFLLCLTAMSLQAHLRKGLVHESNSKVTPVFGSRKGNYFTWVSSLPEAEIREIHGRKGWYIDQVTVETEDGHHHETSPSFGGHGGDAYSWVVPHGEHIEQIEYRQGDWLDSVTFVTDHGTKSPTFGGNGGGAPQIYHVPHGYRLAGVYGFTDPYVKGLGFYLVPIGGRHLKKLHVYGNYNAGTHFKWVDGNHNADLAEIEGRAGWYIDQIKFYLTNGKQSYQVGGNGGDAYDRDIFSGQYITEVKFKYGDWLDSVTFVTNKGELERIGGTGGSHTGVEVIPDGATIVGFYGTHNGQYLLSLGLIIAE